MARDVKNVPADKQVDVDLRLNKFNGGLVTLVDESLLPDNAVKVAQNLIQTQDGRWSTRWGTGYYGTTLGGTIEGADRYVSSTNVSHLVVVVKRGTGVSDIKRSTNDGQTWTTCTGATLTSGNRPYFLQINNYLYIANGVDNMIRYDGTSTLLTYTALATPGTVTPTRGSGLSAGSYSNFYKVTAVNTVGETAASAEATMTTNIERSNWKNDPTAADTQNIDLSWSAVPNAVRYNIYWSDVTGQEIYLDSVSGTSYHDNGKVSTNGYIFAPSADSTVGPKFGPMELSGNRIWGTKDPSNQWRVYWSGTYPAPGAFNPYYDGGYVDLELGGAERPQRIIHYRDGKGGSFATVLTSDPEGNGSIWQIDLQTITIGNFSYTQPVPVKIVGSVGTIAPLSVVKVRNDIMFFNRKGFFTLGSKAQMLNLLSTDEVSSNIRPDVRNFKGTLLTNVAGYYYDAKVFYTVPSNGGSTVNDTVYVNDTERRNWSGPWTFGVERFLGYADSSGNNHLLATPANGSQLLEISSSIQGDLGQPFTAKLITGLIPVSKDRYSFAKIQRAYVELSQPVGPISFQVLGTQKKKAFSAVNSLTISDTVSNVGWDTFAFDKSTFDDTSVAPTTFSRSTIKKSVRVNKLLNNIQFQISTTTTTASFTLLSLKATGFIVPTRDPNDWRT